MATEAQINNLMGWKFMVAGKDILEFPAFADDPDTDDVYERFTGMVKKFAECVLSGYAEGMDNMREEQNCFNSLGYDPDSMNFHWWEIAKDQNKKELEDNAIPPIDNLDDDSKKKVYDAFMPAYRAIKESFDNRSFLQWIFNHKEYTAERDSLKALKGLMQALTLDDKQAFNDAYNTYKGEVVIEKDVDKAIRDGVKAERARLKELAKTQKDDSAELYDGERTFAEALESENDVSVDVDNNMETDNEKRTKMPVNELKEPKPETNANVVDVYQNIKNRNLNDTLDI